MQINWLELFVDFIICLHVRFACTASKAFRSTYNFGSGPSLGQISRVLHFVAISLIVLVEASKTGIFPIHLPDLDSATDRL